MAAGIWTLLALAALALLFLTFRSGVPLYQKILAYVVVAALAYFYWPEFMPTYQRVLGGDYKNIATELVAIVELALPTLAFALILSAFFTASALDAGKLLFLLFILFLVAAVGKIVTL
ncbi:MAG TPA: hypothetical protein PLY93_02940 [Turneriella sp.]|nr:hypothetical protein [Turneriella sp.]